MNSVRYICPLCGNSDERFIALKNGAPYCRKCVGFIGESALKDNFAKERSDTKVHLEYELSAKQAKVSKQLLENYKNGFNTLVYAVCGAGKTEIVYNLISYVLSIGLCVGFAIPRRDVVIELFERLKSAFPKQKVISVYGGHNDKLEGDIVVLTTHQLYRYRDVFGLLIVDEIDAFPFKNNDILHTFSLLSCSSNYVYMSATPSKKELEFFSKGMNKTLRLMSRYHEGKLPVPKVYLLPSILSLFAIIERLKEYKKEKKPVFVFCPTIALCKKVYAFLNFWEKGGACVHSKNRNRSAIIQQFKDRKIDYLVTTSILERGVTVRNLQVIIYHCDHDLYDWATLVQISGRVGRKADAKEGDVIFYAMEQTYAMDEAIRVIEEANLHL